MALTPELVGPSVARAPAQTITRLGRLILVGLLLSTIFLQRFALPLGSYSVPIILPLGLAAIGLLIWRADVQPVASRATAFLAAAGLMAGAAYLAARYSTEVHIAALLIVLAVWSPWVVRARGDAAASRDGFRRMASAYTTVMFGLATVAVLQIVTQFLGIWRYQDYLSTFVPSQFLLPGYNTSIPLTYASPIYKSQAFVFLEPSHFSQYTAVAIIIAILMRAPFWKVATLGLGLVTALSGTGLLVAAVGLVALLIKAPRLVRPVYVIAIGLGLTAALVSPLSSVFSNRLQETDYQTSSLSLRFALPYQEASAGMHEDPRRWVSGAGPGSSDRVLESGQHREGLHIVYTIPTKVLFEYGFFAAAAFLAFVFIALFRAPPAVVLPVTTLAWLFFMGGYLAIPSVTWTVWLLSPVWTTRD